MDKENIEEVLEQLKAGAIPEYLVKKEDFLAFREVLVKRKDFKHFRGVAQRGGDVIFQYSETPRS